MNRELIINAQGGRIDIALLENGNLVELHQEDADSQYSVGDIFLGKVNKVLPGLNASFVNVGKNKAGFLHYSDLGPQIRTFKELISLARGEAGGATAMEEVCTQADIFKGGQMSEVLQKGNLLMLQVLKEPISTKGPRMTGEITLAGRFVVLIPFGKTISISKRIKDNDERDRLEAIASKLCSDRFGLIIRTAAMGEKSEEIHRDIVEVMQKWSSIVHKCVTAEVPAKLLSEVDKVTGLLRDLVNESFHRVVVNDKQMADELRAYLAKNAKGKEGIVEYDKQKVSIFEQHQVNRQIKTLFGKTVNLANGSYLVIEHTEAMTVIDVNSGHKMSSQATNQDDNALRVNLDAAAEVARQVRLRDIGGIIIIDFIDLRNNEYRNKLAQQMRSHMSTDRAKHTILPLTKFGLMQITRQRVKPAVDINTSERCPSCNGSGAVSAPVLVVDDIEKNVSYLLEELNYPRITIHAHPFVEAYLKIGMPSRLWKWIFRHKKRIEVVAKDSMALTDYHLFDAQEERINI